MSDIFHAVATEIKHPDPHVWSSLKVEIFDKTDVKVGEYTRNYNRLFNTFYPFQQDGKWYALYSKNYTATCIMSLPDCKDVCGEQPTTNGFCPTGYYVPEDKKYNGQFGFICGCIWGNDWFWHIQYLDLSKITQGIFVRENRWPLQPEYAVSQAHELPLAIDLSEWPIIKFNKDYTVDMSKFTEDDNDD